MSVPGVKKIFSASESLMAAADELRSAQHDDAVEMLGTISMLLGMWIAKITIEHSKRNAEVVS